MLRKLLAISFSTLLLYACKNAPSSHQHHHTTTTKDAINEDQPYKAAMQFVGKYTKAIQLKDSTSPAVLTITPAWQGRIISSAVEVNGDNFGWLNYDLIAGQKSVSQVNLRGGEDRIDIAPDSFYFAPHDTIDATHWHTPPSFDTEPFQVTYQGRGVVTVEKDMHLLHHNGQTFDINVQRKLTLIARKDIPNYLDQDVPRAIKAVAHESENVFVNTGRIKWDGTTGQPAIRVTGMFPAGEQVWLLVPFNEEKMPTSQLDQYMKEVDYDVRSNTILVRLKGANPIAVGIPQAFGKNYIGVYDAESQQLTIVQFTLSRSKQFFKNNRWPMQSLSDGFAATVYYAGEKNDTAINSGYYYSIASYSPLSKVNTGGRLLHYHRTFHLVGTDKQLSGITKKLFGVTVQEIKQSN
ncbi:hypothetical protein LX64_04029 [Chitinophaga skermanii]|uniref:Uncharacterized protein n=1 Tax=Chitinophaga skermanii TaxID=331697 RepID=A0A327QF74_9BACT|nr:DUF6786 family protein [Chitinophaga skermanii]RAJ00327.1 hypothetical protein LX64_04029 [Chitinophaga skermanii]